MNSPRVQFSEPCHGAKESDRDGGDGVPNFTTLSSEAYIKMIALTPIPPQHDPDNKNKSSSTTATCSKQLTSANATVATSDDYLVDGQHHVSVKNDEEGEDCLEAMRKVLADMGRDRTNNNSTAAAKQQNSHTAAGTSQSSSSGTTKLPHTQQSSSNTTTSTSKKKGEMSSIDKRENAINKLRELLYERFRVHVPISSEDLSAQLQHTLEEEQSVEHRFLHHTATTAARRKVVIKHKKLLKMQPHQTAAVSSQKRSLDDIISDEEDEDLKTMAEYSAKLHALLLRQQAARNRLSHPQPTEGVASQTPSSSDDLIKRIHKRATIARAKRVGAEAKTLSENRKMMEITVPDVVAQPKPLFSTLNVGKFQTVGAPQTGLINIINDNDGDDSGVGSSASPPPPQPPSSSTFSPRNVGGKGGRGNTDYVLNATATTSSTARQTAQQRILTWNRQNSPKKSRVNIETGCCDLAGETILAGASQILSPKVKLERRLQSPSPLRSPSRSPKRSRGPVDDKNKYAAPHLTTTTPATTTTTTTEHVPPPLMEGVSGGDTTNTTTTDHQPPLLATSPHHKHAAVKFSLIGENDHSHLGEGSLLLLSNSNNSNYIVPSPPARSRLENSARQSSNMGRSLNKSSSAKDATALDLSHEQSISNLFGEGYFTNNNNNQSSSALDKVGGGSGVGKPPTSSSSPKKAQHGTSPSNFNNNHSSNKQALLIQSSAATKKRTKSVTEGIELLTDMEYARMMGLGGPKAMRAFLEEDAGAYMAVPSALLQSRSQRHQIEKASAAAIREQYEKEEELREIHGGRARHLSLPPEDSEEEQSSLTNNINTVSDIGGNTPEQKPSHTTTSPLQMDVSYTVKVLSQNHSSSFDGVYKDINTPAKPEQPTPMTAFTRPPPLLFPPASPHRKQVLHPSTAAATTTTTTTSSSSKQRRAGALDSPMSLMVSSSVRPPSSPSKSKIMLERSGGSKRRAAPGPLLQLHDSIASPRKGRSSPPQFVALGGRKLRSPFLSNVDHTQINQ